MLRDGYCTASPKTTTWLSRSTQNLKKETGTGWLPYQLLNKAMRSNYKAIDDACKALGTRINEHVSNYGHDIESRLTGKHETAPYNKFSYGVSNRGASVRIPWQVARDQKGYAEDRRPNANMDPYVVTQLILETVCGQSSPAKSATKKKSNTTTKKKAKKK